MAGPVFVRILHKKDRRSPQGDTALYIHLAYTPGFVEMRNNEQIFSVVLVNMAINGREL